MKRLPTEDQLRDTIQENDNELLKLSTHDLDRIAAVIEGRIYECERAALASLNTDMNRYYAGGIYHLDYLLAAIAEARRMKVSQN